MFLRIIHSRYFERQQTPINRAVKLDAVSPEATQILSFIVGLPVLPAAPQDAQPFEGDHPNGRPPTFALGQLVLIEQPGPFALANRTLGKLDDALMHEDRAGIAEVDDFERAAFFFDGCHATKA